MAESVRGRSRSIGARKSEYWTNEEIMQLSDLWIRDVPIPDIARIIDRSSKSVAVKASRIGLKGRSTETQIEELKSLPNAGLRNCLNCQKLFHSEGFGNRICGQCKNSVNWETGSEYAFHLDLSNLD